MSVLGLWLAELIRIALNVLLALVLGAIQAHLTVGEKVLFHLVG